MVRYAEDLSYWKTSQTGPDQWIEKAKRYIQELGGEILGEGFGSNAQGKAAFMIAFEIEGESFKVIWPIVESQTGNERATRIQAATSLYHYVKGTCLYAVVVGFRTAFFSHLMLPGGKVASEIANEEISNLLPEALLSTKKVLDYKK